MIRGVFVGAMALLLGVTCTATATSTEAQSKVDSMNIKMTIAGQIITATLEESHSTREFFAMLPRRCPSRITPTPRRLLICPAN